jgi:ABC-type transport system involved in cytochrome bd biosynthesis fused ATPase/permease subunit
VVGEHAGTLSGGEARRLALARLFVGDFQAVVLDEPSEHLDALTAEALLDDLFGSFTGVPLLVVTHDPDVIARCDRTVELAVGAVPYR